MHRGQDYIPGPIPAKDWMRFQHYAPYIRVLRYSNTRATEPLVFAYFQQRAGDNPVFPHLQELIWAHATPEMALMASPSLMILRIPEDDDNSNDNGGELDEFGFRSRRHALKSMLPSTLARTPVLEVLELRLMGHESFWAPLSPAFGSRKEPPCPHFHTVHITESPRVLTKAALDALSKVERLADLRINTVGTNYLLYKDWNVPSIMRTFASLERLHLKGSTAGVSALVCAIVTPGLADVELEAAKSDGEVSIRDPITLVLSTAFDTLCRRNATTLRRLTLDMDLLSLPAALHNITRPLLELCHLQELTLVHSEGDASMTPSSVAAAWPPLRKLVLPECVLTPDALLAVAHTCTALEQLSVGCLSTDFVDRLLQLATPARIGDGAPALRQLNVGDALPPMGSADARKVASFVVSLFPRLEAETCPVLFDATHTHRGVHEGGSCERLASCNQYVGGL